MLDILKPDLTLTAHTKQGQDLLNMIKDSDLVWGNSVETIDFEEA